MKRITTNLVAVAALLVMGATTAAACPLVYAVNFSGQFGLLDLATGSFTPVGPGLPNVPDGLVGSVGGPFYTVDGSNGHLLKIGTDGSTTDVGDTGTGPQMAPHGISVIGSLADGSLYAVDFSNNLMTIDRNTATVKVIAKMPELPQQEPDYSGNMTSSFTGDATHLYLTFEIFDGPGKFEPTLFVINPLDAMWGQVPVESHRLKEPGPMIGSGVVNGVIYLFTATGEITKLDVAAGVAMTVAKYDSGLTDDTPPLTGIFGVIGAMEPNGVLDPQTNTVTTCKGPAHYQPRYLPRGARGK